MLCIQDALRNGVENGMIDIRGLVKTIADQRADIYAEQCEHTYTIFVYEINSATQFRRIRRARVLRLIKKSKSADVHEILVQGKCQKLPDWSEFLLQLRLYLHSQNKTELLQEIYSYRNWSKCVMCGVEEDMAELVGMVRAAYEDTSSEIKRSRLQQVLEFIDRNVFGAVREDNPRLAMDARELAYVQAHEVGVI